MRYYVPTLSLVATLLMGCQGPASDYDELSTVQNLSAANIEQTTEIEAIRYEMLRDTSLTYSSQMAFAKHAKMINIILEENQRLLNNSFNFQPLVLEDNVVPPVVLESSHSVERPSGNTLIVADRTFEINKNAYFQTSPLTWRDYLFISYSKPAMPDKSLLPQNRVEQEVWSDYSRIGWDAGREQAYATLNENLKQLIREYQGMVNYHRLLVQGIVTSPQVNYQDNGVSTSDHKMNVNQRVLSIDIPTKFNDSAELWHSFIFFHDDER